MKKNATLGIFGVLGIWLTSGIAFPLINVLDELAPTQLMACRGLLTAGLALLLLKGAVGKVDHYTHLLAIVLPLATLGLFQSIRFWGAAPTAVVIASTPLVNLVIGRFIGRTLVKGAIASFVLVIGGIVIALWNGSFQWEGFIWVVIATILNGVIYELFARAKASSFQKCLYGSVGMAVLGLLVSLGEGDSWSFLSNTDLLVPITGFAFVGGFLYWISNLITFENLSTTEASILAQGETPAVIIGANFILGEYMSLIQWIGVLITFCGTAFLSFQLSKRQGA